MTKIMLVEDDENLREIYGARLQAEGYEIVSVSDGEQALASVVKEEPDLIILDVMMPKISGFDVLDILRTTPETKDTKVIMMTALSQESDRQRGENLGANKYLVKSQVTLEDVVNTVHEVLEGSNSAQTPAAVPQPVAAEQPTVPVSTPSPSVATSQPSTTPAGPASQATTETTQAVPAASVVQPDIANTTQTVQVDNTQPPAQPQVDPTSQSQLTTPQKPQPPTNETAPGGYSSPKPEAGIDITPPPARATVSVRKAPTEPVGERLHVPPPPPPRPEPNQNTVTSSSSSNDVQSTQVNKASDAPNINAASQGDANIQSGSTTDSAVITPTEQPGRLQIQVEDTDSNVAQNGMDTTNDEDEDRSSTELNFDIPDSPSRKKKVIQPINDPTQKPDLKELARRELEKQQQADESHQAIDGGLSEPAAQEKSEVENQIHSYMADGGDSYQERQQQMTPGQTITPGSPVSDQSDENTAQSNNSTQNDQVRPEDIAL
ncbi:response regulator [Candidatus Saccharibacteria bacterium CPR2]|nr:response regulator [Candidatus Saccharibacteria bacterium CPR2]